MMVEHKMIDFIPQQFTRRRAMSCLAAALGVVGLTGGVSLAQSKGISGQYEAEGLNPDGSAYSGTVVIEDKSGNVTIEWVVAGRHYSGTGAHDGRVAMIEWGDSSPVIYVIMANGQLHGTWADGRAVERLLPVQ